MGRGKRTYGTQGSKKLGKAKSFGMYTKNIEIKKIEIKTAQKTHAHTNIHTE